jgi:hypothetical protein
MVIMKMLYIVPSIAELSSRCNATTMHLPVYYCQHTVVVNPRNFGKNSIMSIIQAFFRWRGMGVKNKSVGIFTCTCIIGCTFFSHSSRLHLLFLFFTSSGLLTWNAPPSTSHNMVNFSGIRMSERVVTHCLVGFQR